MRELVAIVVLGLAVILLGLGADAYVRARSAGLEERLDRTRALIEGR